MISIIKIIILAAGLVVVSIEDIYRKEISSLTLVILSAAGVVCSLLGGEWSDWSVIMQWIPGIVVLLIAWLTRESIGYGDGLVLLSIGCFLKFGQILSLCLVAMTIAGLVGLFMLLILKKGRKKQMPFVPFIFLGYVTTLLI